MSGRDCTLPNRIFVSLPNQPMFFLYYLVLKPVSLLPWPMVYGLAHFLNFIASGIFRYRVKVATHNIRQSFPEFTDGQIKDMRRKTIRNFYVVLVESFKVFSMGKKEFEKRIIATNPEIVDKYCDEGRSVIIVGAHYNNWEFVASGINPWLKHQTCGIYKQFKNKFVERKMLEKRSVCDMLLVSRTKVRNGFFDTYKDPLATFFVADQSPSIAKKVYWTTFLNQETAVAFGPEKFAKEQNAPVFYAYNDRVKKGHYALTFELLCAEPLETEHGEITESHVRALEKVINEKPDYWLWTHKRWKRKRKEGE